MAKYRTIQNTYWADDYIYQLPPNAKLLFIFLLTNSFVSNLGVADLHEEIITAFTKLQPEEVRQLLSMFEKDGKIARDGCKVLVVNFIKHQTNNTEKNCNLIKNLRAEFDELKDGEMRNALEKQYANIFSADKPTYNPHITPLQVPCKALGSIEKEKEREKEICCCSMEKKDNPEQLKLLGNETDDGKTARPFNAKDFMQLWNTWITTNDLKVERLQKITDERRRKFEARQKTYAKEGAYSREFWACLLSVVIEANSGFYIGNRTPQAGYSKPFVISFDWLFKNDTHIAKLLEAQEEGGTEWATL